MENIMKDAKLYYYVLDYERREDSFVPENYSIREEIVEGYKVEDRNKNTTFLRATRDLPKNVYISSFDEFDIGKVHPAENYQERDFLVLEKSDMTKAKELFSQYYEKEVKRGERIIKDAKKVIECCKEREEKA